MKNENENHIKINIFSNNFFLKRLDQYKQLKLNFKRFQNQQQIIYFQLIIILKN